MPDKSDSTRLPLYSDTHINLPRDLEGLSKNIKRLARRTTFHVPDYEGLVQLIHDNKVDMVGHVGDIYNVSADSYSQSGLYVSPLEIMSVSSGYSRFGPEGGALDMPFRYSPEKFVRHLVSCNPAVSHIYVPGNWDGISTSKDSHPYIQFLKRLEINHANFKVRDVIKHGNLMALHGHCFKHLRPELSVESFHEVAEKVCGTSEVKTFIDEQTEAQKSTAKKPEIYVVFGDTHIAGQETFDRKDALIHVVNLGGSVAGRDTNYQIVHFKGGKVDRLEPVNFKKIGRVEMGGI